MTTSIHADRQWFTTAQAADYSDFSYLTVLRALEAGELKGGQPKGKGGRWRISRASLDAWLGGEAA